MPKCCVCWVYWMALAAAPFSLMALTRAQFAKMAVVMLGKKGAVGQYQTYTIFPDVRADHWAAGYINLAVRGEEKRVRTSCLPVTGWKVPPR